MTLPNDIPPVHLPPPSLTTQRQRPFYRQIGFWLGFIGWYVINGLIWAILAPGEVAKGPSPAFVFFVCLYGGNLLVWVIAAILRRRFAEGEVVAVGVNFVITIVGGGFRQAAFIQAFLAIPFFIR